MPRDGRLPNPSVLCVIDGAVLRAEPWRGVSWRRHRRPCGWTTRLTTAVHSRDSFGGGGEPSPAALAFAVNTAFFAGAFKLFPSSPVAQLAIFGVGSWIAIALARAGWPALWRVLLAYGLAARIPVVVVMFLAIFLGWDSHYAKPRPDFPPMGPWGSFAWTALLPQMSLWIYLTVV